jgi:hypothetical protein
VRGMMLFFIKVDACTFSHVTSCSLSIWSSN